MDRKYLEDACLCIETNNTTLNILSSNSEIGLGFFVIILLFSRQRNIVQAFMYWQLLKHMYRAPMTFSYHRSAWEKIGMHAKSIYQSLCSNFTNPYFFCSTMVSALNLQTCTHMLLI
eukprot:Gb_12607 [translate_table: standard]